MELGRGKMTPPSTRISSGLPCPAAAGRCKVKGVALTLRRFNLSRVTHLTMKQLDNDFRQCMCEKITGLPCDCFTGEWRLRLLLNNVLAERPGISIYPSVNYK